MLTILAHTLMRASLHNPPAPRPDRPGNPLLPRKADDSLRPAAPARRYRFNPLRDLW